MSPILSPCGLYRYWLERDLSGMLAGPTVAWIMVNPSTADATEDDHTIRKVIGFSERVPCITASVDGARTAHAKALPNFWISSGLCSLSCHASTGPDYNGPAGDALREAWPEERFHEGFHADLASGDCRFRECRAIPDVTLQALVARAEQEGFRHG